jgi:hypothetical protein
VSHKPRCRCQATLRDDGSCPFRCPPPVRRRQSEGVRGNEYGQGKVLGIKELRAAMRRKFPGDSAKWNARAEPVKWGAR